MVEKKTKWVAYFVTIHCQIFVKSQKSSPTYPPATKYRRSQFWRPPSCHLTGRSQTPVTGRRCFHRYQRAQCGEWGPPGRLTTTPSERWTQSRSHNVFMLHKGKLIFLSDVRGESSWWGSTEDLHDISPQRQQMLIQPTLAENETLKHKISHYLWEAQSQTFRIHHYSITSKL